MYFTFIDLFSWIGGFRKGIETVSKELGIKTQCLWYSEIDNFAKKSYEANYTTSNEIFMWDITTFNDFDKIKNPTIIFWWFPCQPFSIAWKKLWFEDDRWNLFFNILNLIKNTNPKYCLLENVKNLKTHDQWKTFKIIKENLEKEWYIVKEDIFNTVNFWIPQNRNRVYIFCIRKDLTKKDFDFSAELVKEHFLSKKHKHLKDYNWIIDILDKVVDKKYYLSDKVKNHILCKSNKNYKFYPKINRWTATTLLSTMHKMHRANVDNYYSDNFIQTNNEKYSNLSVEEMFDEKIRRLTPLEALKLQWFDENFYNNCKKVNISDTQLYRQAGNAVSVNVVYAILLFLFDKWIINE